MSEKTPEQKASEYRAKLDELRKQEVRYERAIDDDYYDLEMRRRRAALADAEAIAAAARRDVERLENERKTAVEETARIADERKRINRLLRIVDKSRRQSKMIDLAKQMQELVQVNKIH